MPALSATDIAAIVPGAVIRRIINGTASTWQSVCSIHARGTSVQGKAYVCGYTQYTPDEDGKGGSQMSFSVAEDDAIVEIQSSPLWDTAGGSTDRTVCDVKLRLPASVRESDT